LTSSSEPLFPTGTEFSTKIKIGKHVCFQTFECMVDPNTTCCKRGDSFIGLSRRWFRLLGGGVVRIGQTFGSGFVTFVPWIWCPFHSQ